MKITLAQYPGFTQNLVTLGQVDLSDNDPEVLAQLVQLLEAALDNIAQARAIQRTLEELDDE